MDYISKLSAKLGVDTTSFNRGMRNASKVATSFTKSFNKELSKFSMNSAKADKIFKRITDAETQKQLKATKHELKDVTRIVQGILISQAFYRMTNKIQEANAAIIDFSKNTEKAEIAFKGLMKDPAKGTRFNEMLKDFAADMPISYAETADSARKLLAYSFDPKYMGDLMTTLTDTASASGDPEAFSRIAKALGQIKTKGRLAAQELLQLTETGVPAFTILQEELGLTAKQMARIGDMRIPADTAIAAVMRGMQKRYGGAGEAMSKTVSGLESNLKDNALIVGQAVYKPAYEKYRQFLIKASTEVSKWREIVQAEGLGGLVQNLVPPEVFPKLQLFASNMRVTARTIKGLFASLAPTAVLIGGFFANSLNLVLPLLNTFVIVLTHLINSAVNGSAATRYLVAAIMSLVVAGSVAKTLALLHFSIKGLLIAKAAGKALLFLSGSVKLLMATFTAHPLIALLTIAAASALGWAFANNKLGSSFDKIAGKVNKAFGSDANEIFKKETIESSEVTDEFNEKIELTKEQIDAVGDASKKAGKKAREALLSFDEVFNLSDKDEASEGLDEIEDGLGEITIPPFNTDGLFPDIGDAITDWTSGIADDIKTKLSNALIGAGIGAVIGGIIGGIFAGPIGTIVGVSIGSKIGALAGGIAGFFWDEIKAAFGDPNVAKGASIGGAIGAAIGSMFGVGPGTAVGAVIGIAAGAIIGKYWEEIEKAVGKPVLQGAAIGALIGGTIGLFFGPVGLLVGAAIGGAAGGVVTKYWDKIKEAAGKPVVIGSLIGGLIGAAIGSIFGPIGMMVGLAIGTAAGQVVTTYWDKIKAKAELPVIVSSLIGGLIGGAIGMIFGPAGMLVGTAIGGAGFGVVTKYWDKIKEKAGMPVIVSSLIGGLIGAAIGAIFGPLGMLVGSAIGYAAGGVVAKYWDDIKGKAKPTEAISIGIGTLIGGVIGSIFGPAGAMVGAAIGAAATSVVSTYWTKIKDAFNQLDWSFFSNAGPDSTPFTGSKAGGALNKSNLIGHANGGIFNKEHIARFAEGGRKEAVIPLENSSGMQPFVDAVSNGLTSALMPMFATLSQGNNNMPVVQVHTLIADERGLKELERKLNIVRMADGNRRDNG